MHSPFSAVYVDRRAARERIEFRSENTPSVSTQLASPQINGTFSDEEHVEVAQNVRTLLSSFGSVSVCTSGQACVSLLSDIEPRDSTPVLLVLEVPLHPQPDEDTIAHDERHDSGIASGPADMLYGLPLLKFIAGEIANKRVSSSVVPVVVLGNNESAFTPELENSPGLWSEEKGADNYRELQCVDNGAYDAFRSPFTKENAKSCYMHCYRHRNVRSKEKRFSLLGTEEKKLPLEANNYSYLREKMVSELMLEICEPKEPEHSLISSQVRISRTRAKDVQNAIARWDFSAHNYNDEELVYCAQLMFQHAFTMPEAAEYRISQDNLTEFLMGCRAAYNDQVPYHNFRHVVDVLQAVFYFLVQLGALPPYTSCSTPEKPPDHQKSLSRLITPSDALTLLVVAIGHDVGHPGVNNAFLVTLKAPLAQVYNDRSVLESFHCAAFSQVLRKYWPKTLEMRKMMIDMILATDMGLHFDYMGKLDKLRKKTEKDGGSHKWESKTIAEYRSLLCALLIKCADISNVARKHDCSAQWATILIDEFARQAHMEKDLGIPSSLVAPPITGSVLALAKSQVGFMGLFAIPLFEGLCAVLPEMEFSVRELGANKEAWSKKIEEYTVQTETVSAPPQSEELDPPKASRPRLLSAASAPSSIKKDVHKKPSTRDLPPVLGTVLMESDFPDSDDGQSPTVGSGSATARSGAATPRPLTLQQPNSAQSTNGNNAVTVVVTHPKPVTNGFHPPFADKQPHYQQSTEHLRHTTPSETSGPDRPRSSPPDLGDASEHSGEKGGFGPTIVTAGTVQRRSSRFFKKVKIWKPWKKESDGSN